MTLIRSSGRELREARDRRKAAMDKLKEVTSVLCQAQDSIAATEREVLAGWSDHDVLWMRTMQEKLDELEKALRKATRDKARLERTRDLAANEIHRLEEDLKSLTVPSDDAA